METLSRRRKRRVGLWHNYRRAPAVQLAARMIARGDIGEVRQVRAVYLQDWLSDADAPASWRTDRKLCGSGAHGDLNAHLIDLTRCLTGLEFDRVCALQQTFTKQRPSGRGKKSKVTVDDALAFLAQFKASKGGVAAIGTYEATRTAPGRKNYNRIEINGSVGSIVWNLERMNELEFFSSKDKADAQGFRTIMCMDNPHPYAANWWPDGHIIGYEHTFVHHVVDFVTALATGKPTASRSSVSSRQRCSRSRPAAGRRCETQPAGDPRWSSRPRRVSCARSTGALRDDERSRHLPGAVHE
jgi:predicted dehydrogenase